jgi:hypothetical protein
MTRSVEELRRESERSRAELAATVEHLKERISDTAEDIRRKVSPQHIKSEVAHYVSDTSQSWLDALKQKAMENPMQTIAAGTAVAVPLWRLARGVPLPLLMIGAGLALTSKTVRSHAAAATASGFDTARDMTEDAAARAHSMRADVEDVVSSARGQAEGITDGAQDIVAGASDTLRNRAAQSANAVADKFNSSLDAAQNTIQRAQTTARDATVAATNAAMEAPAKAGRVIGDNAALIAGVGIAIGAVIAAALPKTRAEAKAVGQASDRVKQAAGEAAQTSFESAKDAAVSAVDAAAKSVADADLGEHASRISESIAGTLKEVADDVVANAFKPSRKSST